jgi:hypothetical protein
VILVLTSCIINIDIKGLPAESGSEYIMLAISLSILLLSSLIRSLNFKSIANLAPIKNIATAALILGSVVVALGLCSILVDQETLSRNLTNLSTDYKLYMCIVFEYLGLLSMRKNYAVNGNNVTAINFCMFFSLALVPIISYYGSDILGFGDTLKVNYESQTEFWMFTGSLTVLVFIYFADKLKGHINNWFYLLVTPLILSNTMFLSTKLMQANNPYIVALLVSIPNLVISTFTFLAKKEYQSLNKTHLKPLAKIFLGSTVVLPLSTIIVQLIAVEFITLLARIAQIVSGAMVDVMYGNRNTINNKDLIVILAMLAIGLTMYYLRG